MLKIANNQSDETWAELNENLLWINSYDFLNSKTFNKGLNNVFSTFITKMRSRSKETIYGKLNTIFYLCLPDFH